MKKISLSIIAFCLFTWTVAQQVNKQELDTAFKSYFKALEQKNISKIVSYLPHQLFTITDRSDLEDEIASALHRENFSVDFSNMKINKIAEIIQTKGIFYSMINYEFLLIMKAEKKGDASKRLRELYESYKSVMDENQIQFDHVHKILSLRQNTIVYAINDPVHKGWKFLDNQMYLVYADQEIIPESITDKLYQSVQSR